MTGKENLTNYFRIDFILTDNSIIILYTKIQMTTVCTDINTQSKVHTYKLGSPV